MKRPRLFMAVGLILLGLPVLAGSPSSAVSTVPPCTTNQLWVLASGWFGAGGTGAMTFEVANRGSSCRIGGYPVVTFLNASQIAVDHRDVHDSSMLFAEPRALIVTVARGGVATFGVSWADNPVNNQTSKACPSTALAVVVLRQGVGNLWGEVPINSRPCDGWLSITPIEPGAWPRPNE